MAGTFRSGRHRTPTPLKIIKGSRVRGRQEEPRYEPGEPECPTDVQQDPVAMEHWTRLAARLQVAGVLNVGHSEALGSLCVALADFQRVREQLRAMNYQQLIVDEVRDPKTNTVVRRRIRENPLIRRSERLNLLVSRLLGEFGLTPITQSKVNAAPTGPVDPFESFLVSGRPR